MPSTPRDPARYFADHTFAYYTALGASGLATIGLARKAMKSDGLHRLGWGLLAVGEAAQMYGMVRARKRGLEAKRRQERMPIPAGSSDGLRTSPS